MKSHTKNTYESPIVELMEIKSQEVICTSNGINDMNIDPDAGDQF